MVAVQPNLPKGSWGRQRAATIGKVLFTFALMERTLLGIMWVIEDHRALRAHIMPDHAGDRGAVSLVLEPHDHLHISQIRAFSRSRVADTSDRGAWR